MDNRKNISLLPYLLVIASAVLWGIIGIFVNSLAEIGFSREQTVLLRNSSATILLGAFMLVTGKISMFRIRPQDLWCFIGTGLVSLFLTNICYFNAMKYTSISVAAVLMYTAPAFVSIMSAFLFGEKLTKNKIFALILTFIGCAFVCGIFDVNTIISLKGTLLGLGAGIAYALYSIFSRYALLRGYDTLTISFYTFLFCSLGALGVSDLTTLPRLMTKSNMSPFLALGLGFFCCLLPYLLYTEGLKKLDNSHASVLATIEPLVATVISVVIYNEPFKFYMALGIILLFAGIIIMNTKERLKMKYKAVIWDMDGTILDTLTDLMDSVNSALEKNGLPTRTYEQIRCSVGNGVRHLIGLSVPNGENNPNFEKVFSDFSEHYAKNCRNKTRPYDGITDIMRKLREAGIKNAVVSNKVDSAVKELAADFYPDLDFALGEVNGLARKPAPDTVFEAMRALGVTQKESVYIGDSEVDVATARNSGLDCISVLWGFRTRDELIKNGATVFAEKPEDILELLK